MSRTVLDASALIALFRTEPGHELVGRVVESGDAVISAVNLAEVTSKLVDLGMHSQEVPELISPLNLSVVTFDEELAMASARLRPSTRHLGLSLGDRACLAVAQQLGLRVFTTDRVWLELDLGVEIRLVRPNTD